MEIKELELKDVFEIRLKPHEDERGFFMRVFDENIFNLHKLNYKWVQENQARSIRRGIIRGLHLQLPPYSETKLIRCIKGSIFDVFVDLRKGSKTFGKWGSIELSEENKKMILIPRGFAHGYCTLTDITEVLYKVDNYYARDYEVGILWNDPELMIDWPVNEPILSEKDKSNISLKEFIYKYHSIEV